ncbi:MAG: tetratricopeptide repeat protein [bacterium]
MDIDSKEHYKLGKEFFLKNKYDIALEHLEAFEQKNKNYADVYNMLGVIYHLGGRIKDAIRSFEKALKINPGYMEAATNLAITYNDIGQYEKANNVLNKAKGSSRSKSIKEMEDKLIKSKLANLHAQIADLYVEIGGYDNAIEEYQKALDLQPTFVDIKTKLAIAYREKGMLAQAIKELEEAKFINADYIPARVNLGILYYLMRRLDDAIAEWESVLKYDPKNSIANMYLNIVKKEKQTLS